MKRSNSKEPERKQLGVVIDQNLWREFRATAIRLGKTATDFLEQAMRETLEKHGE